MIFFITLEILSPGNNNALVYIMQCSETIIFTLKITLVAAITLGSILSLMIIL